MFNLVWALHHDYVFSNFVIENVVDHSLDVVMSELNWESFESVAFWNMVFYGSLKFIIRKCAAAYKW